MALGAGQNFSVVKNFGLEGRAKKRPGKKKAGHSRTDKVCGAVEGAANTAELWELCQCYLFCLYFNISSRCPFSRESP